MTKTADVLSATLATDGGSRGNPGDAGIGFVLYEGAQAPDDFTDALAYGGAFIGNATNNVAEYSALIWGMENAQRLGVQYLDVQADSELMIKQLTGVYKIKNPDMKRLAARVHACAKRFARVQYRHVYRTENSIADALANRGMDTKNRSGEGCFCYDAQTVLDAASSATLDPSQDTSAQPTHDSASSFDTNTQQCKETSTLLDTNQRLGDSERIAANQPHPPKSSHEASIGGTTPSFLQNVTASVQENQPQKEDQKSACDLSFSEQPSLFDLDDLSAASCATSSCCHQYTSDQSVSIAPQRPYPLGGLMQTDTHHPVVVVGVSGSIAAYKAATLVRLLKKADCSVYVVMSENAQRFVSALTFEELSENPVLTNLFTSSISANPHITLAQMADAMVVAPASANIIAKLSNGIADDALSSTLLANTAPLLIAPAMNHRMYNHVATQTNLTTLAAREAIIIDPEQGDLACGEEGMGCLADPQTIAEAVLETLGR